MSDQMLKTTTDKMGKKLKACLVFTLCSFLSACSFSNNEPVTFKVSASSITGSGLPPDQQAEEFAKSAELLLTGQGFSQAFDMTNQALQLDPHNFRARFIHALLAPVILQKGIMVRVEPLIGKNPLALMRYRADIKKKRESASYSKSEDFFYEKGLPAIESEAEMQQFNDSVTKSLDALRLFARSAKNQQLTVRANAVLVPDIIQRYAQSCEIKETANREYELTCPPSENRYLVTLNQTDFEAIQDMAAFFEIYLTTINAYDLDSAVQSSTGIDDLRDDEYVRKIVDRVLQEPKFGRLREQNTFAGIKGWSLDLVSGLHWAMNHQGELCPKGQSDPHNRVGMWINSGICLSAGYQPYINIVEAAVNAEPQDNILEKNGQTLKSKLNVMEFFYHPITDLHLLGPVTFDACGRLQSTGDPSLAGVFPYRDANSVLPMSYKECVLK
jgi:hypothetical protein